MDILKCPKMKNWDGFDGIKKLISFATFYKK
jgi:hypothetical protein